MLICPDEVRLHGRAGTDESCSRHSMQDIQRMMSPHAPQSDDANTEFAAAIAFLYSHCGSARGE